MLCKNCSSDVKLAASLNRDSNDSNKMYILEWWKCKNCKAVYYAELTHYKSDESIEHAVYLSQLNKWEDEVNLVLTCPKPHRKECHCKAHRFTFNYDYKKMIAYYISK
jgi:hypothetical protein